MKNPQGSSIGADHTVEQSERQELSDHARRKDDRKGVVVKGKMEANFAKHKSSRPVKKKMCEKSVAGSVETSEIFYKLREK